MENGKRRKRRQLSLEEKWEVFLEVTSQEISQASAIESLRELAAEGSIRWERRAYEPADLEGAFMVIAATSDTEVNGRVYDDAERRAMLVNVVDVPRCATSSCP